MVGYLSAVSQVNLMLRPRQEQDNLLYTNNTNIIATKVLINRCDETAKTKLLKRVYALAWPAGIHFVMVINVS